MIHLVLLIVLNTFAQNSCEYKTCPAKLSLQKQVSEIQKTVELSCNQELKTVVPPSLIDLIKKENPSYTLIDQATDRTISSVEYKIPDKRLKPGEILYFVVPDDLSTKAVSFMVLGHKQDPSDQTGWSKSGDFDSSPGLTSVQVLSEEGDWRYWPGQASGNKGAKFAEVRYDYEMENLYDWDKYGHNSVVDDSNSKKELRPKLIKLVSVGKDPVHIGQITLKVTAPESKTQITEIFTPGTAFGSKKNGTQTALGGGQNKQGTFPDALVLNAYSKDNKKLPEGWKKEGNDILIPLPKGKTLAAVEIAGGDSHPDKKQNSDGGWGTQGWSKISMGLDRPGLETSWFLKRENAPPEGIIMSSPKPCTAEAVPAGSYLRLRADSDAYYLMGIRLSFSN